ncbi:MAG: ADP-glyceromanno-heptose 6-epimerase [Spirochaetes bacterium]|nr:ADP-glyceromanno-heptose 6-epimerase [Spirochaetota bacterium]
MILVTGGAGFIGSAYVWQLNQKGRRDIAVCDRFESGDKWRNLRDLRYADFFEPDDLDAWMQRHGKGLESIIHLGACSATTENDMDFLWRNNVEFSKRLWAHAVRRGASFFYASSAATYGAGERGYVDDEKEVPALRPLNKYGYSKQCFDLWVLDQAKAPRRWGGLKFFNVFGPNEYHKGGQASVVLHHFREHKASGKVHLFQSHRAGIADGEQKRDFVYVKDAVRMLDFLRTSRAPSGLYNIATGQARTFLDLARALYKALGVEPAIEFIPTPEAIRDKYQYFTEGAMGKLRAAGYQEGAMTLEAAVEDYVKQHLLKDNPYLGG